MSDLTILYYTASTVSEVFARRARKHLLKSTGKKHPIISVSQKPLDFGQNICVGEIGRSKFNCYKQILIGTQEVKTPFVATVDDDSLYASEHFLFRPSDDAFYYETNGWRVHEKYYWRRDTEIKRAGMWGCIVKTDVLIDNLSERFRQYPTQESMKDVPFWGEPASHDEQYGIESELKFFESDKPSVTFMYRTSMGGYRNPHEEQLPENTSFNLEGFGGVFELWHTYWDNYTPNLLLVGKKGQKIFTSQDAEAPEGPVSRIEEDNRQELTYV